MLGKIYQKILHWEKIRRARYSHDIVDPAERKKSQFYADWIDHGILRYRWHNFAEIGPGMYRSNQPNSERFDDYAKLGIKNVLNLRGANGEAPYNFEVESCEKHGFNLIDLPLSARMRPSREQLSEIMTILEGLEGPTLMHCKSGADRTGLVSAIYYLHILGRSVEDAQTMLSLRFVHLNFTKTGILDYVMHLYAKRVAQSPISFKDWAMTEYDPKSAGEDFKDLGFWRRIRL
jgi:protein tyrosine/serine phosphatase